MTTEDLRRLLAEAKAVTVEERVAAPRLIRWDLMPAEAALMEGAVNALPALLDVVERARVLADVVYPAEVWPGAELSETWDEQAWEDGMPGALDRGSWMVKRLRAALSRLDTEGMTTWG